MDSPKEETVACIGLARVLTDEEQARLASPAFAAPAGLLEVARTQAGKAGRPYCVCVDDMPPHIPVALLWDEASEEMRAAGVRVEAQEAG